LGPNTSLVKQAIRLSEEKYCSVGAMVKQTANITTTHEVREENNDSPKL
jgi:uncharacterized OsmC-like protein